VAGQWVGTAGLRVDGRVREVRGEVEM